LVGFDARISFQGVVDTVESFSGQKPVMVASAPGRMDFLNTHQDYKGLPVVPIAVNLRTYIALVRRLADKFRVISLTLRQRGEAYIDEFEVRRPGLIGGGWFGDYLRAVVQVLSEMGGVRGEGGELIIHSDIPIGSGLASSAALEVSFAWLLNKYWELGLRREDIAEVCFKAERGVMGIPCGRLDQYAASIGGGILLYPREPARYERLEVGELSLVAVDSGIRHSVGAIHPVRQAELNEGLRSLLLMELPQRLRALLDDRYYAVRWEEISYAEIKDYLSRLEDKPARRIAYTLLANESTRRAIEIMRRRPQDIESLAKIINEQHELLRDLYDVSLPEIERIREAMLKAGAMGVKISGAGMGGSLLAVCRDEGSAMEALEAALRVGATKGWRLRIDTGATINYSA